MFKGEFVKGFVALVVGIVVVNQSIFFSTLGLLGVDYEGSESSGVYVVYLVLLFVFVFLCYLVSVLKVGLLRGEPLLLLLVIFFVVAHLVWVASDSGRTELLPIFMIHSFVLGFVGLFAAMVMVKFKLVEAVVKILEVLFVIQAVGILMYSVVATFAGSKVASLAGANYQTLSYFSSFTMGMLMAYVFLMPSELRFNFTKSLIYKVLAYVLMFSCAVGVFVGGGRGAFILMVLYLSLSAYNLFGSGEKMSAQKVVVQSIRVLLICSGIVAFLIFFSDRDFIQQGFDRATQFIASDGSIDLHRGSSGRDRVYSDSIDYIFEKPLLGYGPFGVRDKSIHAHNVFLEIWLQFGVVAVLALPIIFIFLYLKMRVLARPYRVWGGFLALYPLILIQFSGSYLAQSGLWFFIGVLMLMGRKSYLKERAWA